MKFDQLPHAVFMIRPAAFGFNPETAASNAFQRITETQSDSQLLAVQEFDTMVELLRSHDIEVHVFDDSASPQCPDAIFPNNWISMHHDGQVILYPMMAPNRRLERRSDIISSLQEIYQVAHIRDLSRFENEGKFLEGTGSIVFDYTNRLLFACRSPRTNDEVAETVASALDFTPVIFDAKDERGTAIYHTNVMMNIGNGFAVICLDSIPAEGDVDAILNQLDKAGTRVVAIGFDQLRAFAGNMLTVRSANGEPYVVMSEASFHSLVPGQVNEITKHAEILPVKIPTIEKLGGGSVRCMMAGIHLPRKERREKVLERPAKKS